MKHHHAALITAALFLPACADDGSEGLETPPDFRGTSNPGYSGDGDLTIYMGADAGQVGCDLWDLTGTDLVGGSASGAAGQVLLRAVPASTSPTGWGIAQGDGALTCVYEWDGNLKLRDVSTGAIVMTSNEVFLMNGDYSPQTGGINWQVMDYTFRDESIREPGWWGDKLVTADVHIAWMQDWRKLMIGAALEGYCGAPGLADAAPPTDHPEG